MTEEQKDLNTETQNPTATLIEKSDKELCEEYLAGWKRAMADYDNLKKESAAKSKDWIEMGMMRVVSGLIPLYSNFASAIDHIPPEQKSLPWVTGVIYIKQNLEQLFTELGLEKIKTVGEQFDANLHEAVKEEVGEGTSGIIIKEAAIGFKKDGKVLIPAKVIVTK